MAAVTKNRNFFNGPLLLYYKSSRSISPQFVNMTELLTIVIQVGDLTRRKTWFNPPFSWEIPVPSRECDSCFLVSHLVVSAM
jgi:hypothetical protein